MNLKDDIEIDDTASDKASSIQIELEQNRKNGSLTSYIRGLEIFGEEKLRKVWNLLSEQERLEYKTWDKVSMDFLTCRNEYSEQEQSLKPADKAVRDENIFRLMKSYDRGGKTLELKIALDIMRPDEKRAYALRSHKKDEQLPLFQ